MKGSISGSRKQRSRIYVDASFLISALIKDHEFNRRAEIIVKGDGNAVFYYSLLTLDETLYTIEKNYKSHKIPLKEGLKQMLNSSNIKLISYTEDHKTVLDLIKIIENYNLRPRDASHFLIMNQNHLTIMATFDNDFIKNQEKLKIKILS